MNDPLPLYNIYHKYTEQQVAELERAGDYKELYLCFRERLRDGNEKIQRASKIVDAHYTRLKRELAE